RGDAPPRGRTCDVRSRGWLLRRVAAQLLADGFDEALADLGIQQHVGGGPGQQDRAGGGQLVGALAAGGFGKLWRVPADAPLADLQVRMDRRDELADIADIAGADPGPLRRRVVVEPERGEILPEG